MGIYCYFSLSTRTFKVTISGFKFLITCLVSEIFKDKKDKKKSMTSQQGKILFLKKQLANMFDVKIHRDLYIYTFCKIAKCSRKFIHIIEILEL